MLNGMERGKISYKISIGQPSQSDALALEKLYVSIFEDADSEFFNARIKQQPKLLSIIAYFDTKAVGFKIGYPKTDTLFYSWIGGVLKTYRKLGIANKLAEIQEENAKKEGHTLIRTKSMNRFRPMMILNLKRHFNIISVYTNSKLQTKIVFEKKLD